MKSERIWILSVAAAVALLTGCGAGDDAGAAADHAAAAADQAAEAATSAEHVAVTVAATPAMTAVLVKADQADGAEDHIVAKCPGCALAMEGSADHAMEVGDYSLHFCSDSCKDRFGENAAQAILELPVGEGDAEASSD